VLRFLTAGESHGPEVLAVVEGLPAGVEVDVGGIDRDLARRQSGYGRGARSTKIERDRGEVVSGLAGGRTTGAPVAIRIVNRDFANQPPEQVPLTAPRPGHADLAGSMKYGIDDFRVIRERASARETAARVAAGALTKQLLRPFGARVESFVLGIQDVAAYAAPATASADGEELGWLDGATLHRLAEAAEGNPLRCPDAEASTRMQDAIDQAKAAGDTVGGIFCVFATGVPPGLGSYAHWDRRLDGRLAQAICSIHAVKGVEIGPAFAVARMPGSLAQDPIEWREGVIARERNLAGGLEGGVTNGEPVVVRAAMKPLSSVRARTPSIDVRTGGPMDAPHIRSDICAVPAAAVVGEAMVAWVLAEALLERFSSDRLDVMLAAFSGLRFGPVEAVDGESHRREERLA
jgi:chorismate synthase